MASLTKKNDVVAAVTLHTVLKLQTVERWYSLKFGEVFGGPTHSADVLSFLQIELVAKEFIMALELRIVDLIDVFLV